MVARDFMYKRSILTALGSLYKVDCDYRDDVTLKHKLTLLLTQVVQNIK